MNAKPAVLDYSPHAPPWRPPAGLTLCFGALTVLGVVGLATTSRALVPALLLLDAAAFLAAIVAMMRRGRSVAWAPVAVGALVLAALASIVVLILCWRAYAGFPPSAEFGFWLRLPSSVVMLTAGVAAILAVTAGVHVARQSRRDRAVGRGPPDVGGATPAARGP